MCWREKVFLDTVYIIQKIVSKLKTALYFILIKPSREIGIKLKSFGIQIEFQRSVQNIRGTVQEKNQIFTVESCGSGDA